MDTVSHETILENLFDGVYFVDRDKRIEYWNRAAERITGFRRDEVIGHQCSDNILRHIDDEGHELCDSDCPLSATLRDGSMREASVYLHHKQGYRIPVSIRISPVRDSKGKMTGCVEVFTDNSTHIRILREMEHLREDVFIDATTGVGNRRFADMTLQTRCHELREFNVPFGVIFLDIDNFKLFNDLYGHAAGDKVLSLVGKTISNMVRRPDAVARWGGEEFIVAMTNINVKMLARIAERIRVFIGRGFIMQGTDKLMITASLGATLARTDDTPESVVERADALMYRSKEAGRNRVTVG